MQRALVIPLLLVAWSLAVGSPTATQTGSGPGSVTIVIGRDVEPYRVAENAIRSRLRLADASTAIQTRLAESAEWSELTDHLVIVIGSKAARIAVEKLAPEVSLGYCLVARPERFGLLTRKNTFGVSTEVGEKEQLDLLHTVLPKTRRVGLLYDPRTTSAEDLGALRRILPAGWVLVAQPVNDLSEFASALDRLAKQEPDAIWGRPDSRVLRGASIRALLLFSVRESVPVLGYSSAMVRAGALCGTSIDPAMQGEQVAEIALVRNESESIEESRLHVAPRFITAVNLIVAERLGVVVPEEPIRRATHVFRGKESH